MVSGFSFLLYSQQWVTLSAAVVQMPLKHNSFVSNNGKNQVSSRHWLLKMTGEESIGQKGLRLK